MELGDARFLQMPTAQFLTTVCAELERTGVRVNDPATAEAPSYRYRLIRLCRIREDIDPAIRRYAEAGDGADLYYAIRYFLEKAPADWDFVTRERGNFPVPVRKPIAVYLERIRSPFNVGSIIRTAEAFGFESVVLGDGCPPSDHPRVRRSAMGADTMIPVLHETLSDTVERMNGTAVALETTGTDIYRFDFPPAGVLVLGSEEHGLRSGTVEYCRGSGGEVSIPLSGGKNSLNVGVAFGIAAALWTRSTD